MAAYSTERPNLISSVSVRLCVWVGLLHLRREINETGIIIHQEVTVSCSSSLHFFFSVHFPIFLFIVLPVSCSGFGVDFRVGEWLASKNDSLSPSLWLQPDQGSPIDAFLSPCLQVRPSCQAREDGGPRAFVGSPFLFSPCFHFLIVPAAYSCEIHLYVDKWGPPLPQRILTKMSVCALH